MTRLTGLLTLTLLLTACGGTVQEAPTLAPSAFTSTLITPQAILSDPTGDARNSCPDIAVTWQTRHIDLEDGTEHTQSWAPVLNIDTYIVHKVFRGSTGTRIFPPHAQNGTSYRILATEGEGWYDLVVQTKNRCDRLGVPSEVRRTGLGRAHTHSDACDHEWEVS